MTLRAVLLAALSAVAAYGVYEVRRWRLPAGRLVSPRQRRIRGWGLFFLIVSLGLMLGATFLHKPRTARAALPYLAYLTLTVITWVPLIPLALLDSRENLRRALEERQKLGEERKELKSLVRETLAPSAREDTDRPDS